MPWEGGFVPSDGYRHYYHGYNEKMEFLPCHHVLEDQYSADNKHHTNPFSHQIMEEIRQQMVFNAGQIGRLRMFPQEVDAMRMNKIQCPRCEVKTEGLEHSINQNFEEMAESKFKAYRIMGWI